MKRIKILFILSTLIFITSCSANKELTELKRKYTSQQAALEKERENTLTLKTQLSSLKDENVKLRKDIIKSIRQALKEISYQEPECPEEMKKGLVFKVQIGAYEKRKLSEELAESVNLDTEQKNGVQKILVGQFRQYDNAKRLKDNLQIMGVSDAFIVPYINDERKELSEVLANKVINN